jgi:hypothetical protein
MFLPSFVPCQGHWVVGVDGEVYLDLDDGSRLRVPDESMALVYSDLVRASEELRADSLFGVLKGRVRKFLERKAPKPTPKPSESALEELQKILSTIGPVGQKVMLEICRRIKRGHDAYGDFKPRNWDKERRDEFFDALVYETAENLQRDATIT